MNPVMLLSAASLLSYRRAANPQSDRNIEISGDAADLKVYKGIMLAGELIIFGGIPLLVGLVASAVVASDLAILAMAWSGPSIAASLNAAAELLAVSVSSAAKLEIGSVTSFVICGCIGIAAFLTMARWCVNGLVMTSRQRWAPRALRILAAESERRLETDIGMDRR